MVDPKWLAGFFDGEGCVLYVGLSQKNRGILDLVAASFPEGKVCRCSDGSHVLRFYGKRCRRFLEVIRSHSLVKRTQIEMAFQFMDTIYPDSSGMGHGKRLSADVLDQRERIAEALRQEKVVMYGRQEVN